MTTPLVPGYYMCDKNDHVYIHVKEDYAIAVDKVEFTLRKLINDKGTSDVYDTFYTITKKEFDAAYMEVLYSLFFFDVFDKQKFTNSSYYPITKDDLVDLA